MICSFENTFCRECVVGILKNVCPGCGGGLEKRPIRPSLWLEKYPPDSEKVFRPVDKKQFDEMLRRYKDVWPDKR
jgi:uncharacterized protein